VPGWLCGVSGKDLGISICFSMPPPPGKESEAPGFGMELESSGGTVPVSRGVL
jgi:hypothetical protein